MENNSIKNILENLSSNNIKERKLALIKLSEQIVFVPATSFEKKINGEETKKIKIVNTNINEKTVIPVFIGEDIFFDYISKHNYQCFSLPLGDLALTVPKDYWILIDQGLETEIYLSPEEINIISGNEPLVAEPIVKSKKDEEEYPIYAEEYQEETETTEEESSAAIAENESFNPYKLNPYKISASPEEIKESLKKILEKYNEIVEAYYIHNVSGTTAVGLVSENLLLESRFNLIEEVSNISREFFGEAGLIEVFDDLASYSSSSWELFKTETPFYEKPKVNKTSIPLSSQMEWSTLRGYEQQNSAASEEQEEQKPSGFSLKNLKFFNKQKLSN